MMPTYKIELNSHEVAAILSAAKTILATCPDNAFTSEEIVELRSAIVSIVQSLGLSPDMTVQLKTIILDNNNHLDLN